MNIGICVIHKEVSIEQSFAQMNLLGFKHCQLISWNGELWTDEEADKINNACMKFGITITAFWCGWSGPAVWDFYDGQETLGLTPIAYRFARMQDLMNGSDFAKKINVKDVITHAGFIPENPHDQNYHGLIASLKVIVNHFRNNGQYFLFETGQETPVTLLRAIEDIGLNNIGINLDPANLIIYGKANPVDALDVFGKYVRGIHAKDGFYPVGGRNLGREVAIGEGKVDFSALIATLFNLKYDGSITIEREIEGEQQIKDILNGKKYLEEIIDKLM
jgi:L-ribulose-5-phosphate 3-epimerase